MRLLRKVQSSLLQRRKKRTAVVTGAANDESMLFRPPTTMIMQLSPLSGVPSYTDEHANPRNFTVAKLLHALEYLRCCNLSAEEEAAHRHQHDCEMMRMAAPLFSLLRSNLSALRRRRSMFQISRRMCSEWPKTSCKMRQRKAKAMTGALSVRPVETAWPTASNKGRSVSYIFEKDKNRPTASITQRRRHSRPHTRRKRIKAPEALLSVKPFFFGAVVFFC